MKFEIHWQTRENSGHTPPLFDDYETALKIVDYANSKIAFMQPIPIFWWVVAVSIHPPQGH